jgi:hypothetical protein
MKKNNMPDDINSLHEGLLTNLNKTNTLLDNNNYLDNQDSKKND